MRPTPNPPINTLHLGPRELNQFLENFEQSQPNSCAPDREFVRWSYRVQAV